MANRIVIDTEVLERTGQGLHRLQTSLARLKQQLQQVNMDQESGGTLDIRRDAYLQCSDVRVSGETVEELVRAYSQGLDATGRWTQAFAQAMTQVRQKAEAAEREAQARAAGLPTGWEACFAGEGGAVDVTLYRYDAPSEAGRVRYEKEKEQLRQDNDFWETEYNAQILDNLRDRIMNNPFYSNESWEDLGAQRRKARIKAIAEDLAGIYGTEAEIVFLAPGEKMEYVTKDGRKVVLEIREGESGAYKTHADCILLNADALGKHDLDTWVALLAHETRHSLQYDIVNTDISDLAEKYDISTADYDEWASFIDARSDWKAEYGEYVTPTNERQVNERAEEIMEQRTGSQKNIFSDEHISKREAREYAKDELTYEYLSQQVEVDAKQVEDSVRDMYKEKRDRDVQEWLKENQ